MGAPDTYAAKPATPAPAEATETPAAPAVEAAPAEATETPAETAAEAAPTETNEPEGCCGSGCGCPAGEPGPEGPAGIPAAE